MNKRISFFNVDIDLLTMDETLERISDVIKKREIVQHVVVNVAKLVYAQENNELRNIINSCKIINVDGAGIILGAKLLGIKIPERVAGIDLMENLIKYSTQKAYRIFFLGAEEEVVSKVVSIYTNKYPQLEVAGYRNGYFSDDEEEGIAHDIKQSKADILFVAMGSPKKEYFLNKYVDTMNVPFLMGVGGSFDVIAGKVKRAPLWMQMHGMEWFYRLMQEPTRMWRRYFYTNLKFLIMIFVEILNKKLVRKSV